MPLDPGTDRALRRTLTGLEAGRWVLVAPDGTLERVGDGVANVLERPAPGAGDPASAVLGDVGTPLPAGVARCVPVGAGCSVEATFAPVPAAAADDVRKELRQLERTLGAPAERPALEELLGAVAGRPADAAPEDAAATLVLLRRMDATSAPQAPPPELLALGPLLDELAALRADLDALRTAGPTHDELKAAREQAFAARQETTALRDELDALREEHQRRLDELADAARGAVRAAEQARRDAGRAQADAEAARAAAAVDPAREVQAAVRPERVVEIWRQMLAAGRPDPANPPPAEALAARDREPEPGFDDAPVPLAHVGLDGRFVRLNPRFARLVGYAEEDFRKATWPSLLDRAGHDEQRARREALVAGEVDRVPLDASYLGGDGLLVTLRGHVELVRHPSGEPSHLLLVGEDRHTL